MKAKNKKNKKNKKTFLGKYETYENAVERYELLYSFLSAAKGNWRNSIYIECYACGYGRKKLCEGFLFVPDYDGTPIVVPVEAIANISGLLPDKEECHAVITSDQFDSLYEHWMEWNISSPKECTLIHMSEC